MNLRKISAAALSMAVSLICISAGAQAPETGAGESRELICETAWDRMTAKEAKNREIVFLAPFMEPLLYIERTARIPDIKEDGTPSTIDDVAKALLKSSARLESMAYQEASKFTYRWFKKETKLAGRQYELEQKMKRFENALGHAGDLRDEAKKIAKTNASAETIKAAQDKADVAYREFLKTIQDEGWAGPNATAYQEYLDFFMEVRKVVPKQEEFSDYLLKAMEDLMETILKTEWDMADLEGENGLHKLRRMTRRLLLIREVLIDRIQVLQGVKMPKKWKFFQQLPPDIGTDEDLAKYLDIHYSDRKIKHPIYVSMEWLRGITVAVYLFGNYKDRGELFESAMEAYRKDPNFPGEEKGKAFIEEELRKKYNWRPHLDEAWSTYDLFMESGLLNPKVFMDEIPKGATLAPATAPKPPKKKKDKAKTDPTQGTTAGSTASATSGVSTAGGAGP